MSRYLIFIIIAVVLLILLFNSYRTPDFDKILNTSKLEYWEKDYLKEQFKNNTYVGMSFRVTDDEKAYEIANSLNKDEFILDDTMTRSEGYAYVWVIGKITIGGLDKVISNQYVEIIDTDCCITLVNNIH